MSKAVVFQLDSDRPNLKRLMRVVEELQKGNVVVVPTDTLYGFCCDITAHKAVDRILAIKGLPEKHFMSCICSDLAQASQYVNLDNQAFSILRRILPGPYTIVLEANRAVPKVLLDKRKTIGIRIPDSPVARTLVDALGRPILSTSVSTPDGRNLLDPEEIYKLYGSQVDMILSQGIIADESSTVLSYADGEWKVLREGKGPVDFL